LQKPNQNPNWLLENWSFSGNIGWETASVGAWLHGHVVPAHPLGNQEGHKHGAGAPSLLKRLACRNPVKT
jgi:hypothetical protein